MDDIRDFFREYVWYGSSKSIQQIISTTTYIYKTFIIQFEGEW